MRRVDTRLVAAFQRRMDGDNCAVFEDTDLIGADADIEDAPAGRIRHAIEIAGNAYHALVRDAPFELENRSVGHERQRFEMWLFPGEGFVDDALRGRVDTGIGDRVEPMPELSVEIIEVAERTAEEEVLANNSGTAARPCPWSWPGKAGRLWAGSRNAGQGRRGCGCKPRPNRHDTITDFDPSEDVVELVGFGGSLSAETGGTELDLGGGNKLAALGPQWPSSARTTF
jgi:hypothetical protein